MGYNVQNKLEKELGCKLDDEFIIDKKQKTTVPLEI